jgi:Flp pilus assembly pilin Flp
MAFVDRLLSDDRGQDIVEYTLLGATVALASLALMNLLPGIMNAVYVSWDTVTQSIWYPDPPAN